MYFNGWRIQQSEIDRISVNVLQMKRAWKECLLKEKPTQLTTDDGL